jgi:pimeloyl-ACP methyl ester carboxylesterase
VTALRAAAVAALAARAALAVAEERHVMTAPGEAIRVAEAGQGKPIVLIPGMLGSAFGYRKVIPPLVERGRRVIVVEPLGIGGSGRPPNADYSLTAQAERIAAVLAALKVEAPVIVAHAGSASMAFRLAYRHPTRVAAIVSLDGGPSEAAASPGLRRAMRFSFLIRIFGGMKRLRETVRSALRERSADPAWVTDEVVDGYMRAGTSDLDTALTGLRGMARAREPEELRPRLSQVRCPVRLVLGTAPHDGGIKPPEIRLLEERLPDLSIVRVEGAGHFVFEEKPGAVVDVVEALLAP